MGFDFLIAVIGLFGIGEILFLDGERPEVLRAHDGKFRLDAVLQTWKKLLPRYWVTSIRSCIVGCWMGITPGGATPASFMSYGLAKRFSKHGDNFGKGEHRGRGGARDGRARRRHQRAAADADARHSRIAHRGGAAGRPNDLGPAARAACCSSSRRTSCGA